MDLDQLEQHLSAGGQPGYRVDQVWEWMAGGAGSYAEMSNLPAALREALEREVPF